MLLTFPKRTSTESISRRQDSLAILVLPVVITSQCQSPSLILCRTVSCLLSALTRKKMKDRICVTCLLHARILYISQSLLALALISTFWYTYWSLEELRQDRNRRSPELEAHEPYQIREKLRRAVKEESTAPSVKNKLVYSLYDEPEVQIQSSESQRRGDYLLEPSGEWIQFPSYSRIPVHLFVIVIHDKLRGNFALDVDSRQSVRKH